MNIQRSVSVPAAVAGSPGTYVEVVGAVRFFVCVAASAQFEVRFGNGQSQSASTGVRIKSDRDIGTLTLSNSSAAAVEVTFVIGDSEFQSQPLPLSSQILFPDAQTQAGGVWGDNTFTGAEAKSYPGTRFGRQRKYIFISNREGSGSGFELQVENSANLHLCVVQPATNQRLDLSDDLVLRNPRGAGAGNGIKVNVFEVF